MKKKRNRAKNPHVRIRYVDFQDISSLANEEVDPFKQEIRDKLIQDAARDLTIKKELADEIKKERIQSKRDQKRRIKYVFFQAEDGIRDYKVTGVQTCALPI